MPIYSVLVVDDEPKVTEMVGHFLKMKGFTVLKAANGVEVLEQAEKNRPELVLMDIRMPKMDGMECLKQMKTRFPETEVIMVTATGEIETAISCMQLGAFGFLMKPVDFPLLYAEANKALEHQSLVRKLNDYQKNLELKVEERTGEISALNQRLKGSFLTSIKMLISLLEAYDPFVAGHLRRVAALSRQLCMALNMPQKDVVPVEMAALLHDIGTVALPRKLRVVKFSELTKDEIALVRQHTVIAQNIMSSFDELETSGLIVRSHLERIDGTGFPDGLMDEKIPFGAKVVGVANAYDELTSRRRFSGEQFGT